MEAGKSEEPTLFPTRVGERLRAARIAAGLDLPTLAERTRIPQRHLEAIEASNYSGLPSITYAMGFAKSYARQVGVDEVALARDLRAELVATPIERAAPAPAYEFGDPSRVPSRGLVLFGVVVALLAMIGAGIWFGTDWFRKAPAPAESLIEPVPAPATPAPAPTPAMPAVDHVTLTATDAVWVRVYDATGKTLFEKTMAAGEAYDVPADANGPKINVGRPDLLAVTVNGSAIPPLGTAARAIKDVPLTGAALRARAAGEPVPSATPTPTPTAAATPATSAPAPRTTAATRPAKRPTPRPTPTATSTPRSLLPPSLVANSSD